MANKFTLDTPQPVLKQFPGVVDVGVYPSGLDVRMCPVCGSLTFNASNQSVTSCTDCGFEEEGRTD